MPANYLHGIETTEVERGPRPIRVVKSAVIAVVGTAPTGPVNELTLCLNETHAAQFGPHLTGFSIPEALQGIYDFGVGTVLVVNVLDPAVHGATVVAQLKQFGNNDLLQLEHGALQTLQIKSADGTVTHAQGTDYTVHLPTGEVRRLATGSIAANAQIQADYTYADPSLVTPADIIGGITVAGRRTGLKAFQDSYNQLGFFPKIFIAPGFSTLKAVTVELGASATQVGGVAYIDAPIGTTVQQVLAGRGPTGTINFDTSSDRVRLCSPT